MVAECLLGPRNYFTCIVGADLFNVHSVKGAAIIIVISQMGKLRQKLASWWSPG